VCEPQVCEPQVCEPQVREPSVRARVCDRRGTDVEKTQIVWRATARQMVVLATASWSARRCASSMITTLRGASRLRTVMS
jgi:hypothetical protein